MSKFFFDPFDEPGTGTALALHSLENDGLEAPSERVAQYDI